jgi:hypothetical protein
MLSDRERATLDAIQHKLMIEDPRFAGSFDRAASGLGARWPSPRRATLTIIIVIAALLTGLMIFVHALGPAMLFTTITVCALIWLRRGRHRSDRH